MGDLMPKEIAIAVPNRASRTALASETHRGQSPNISRIPHDVSATVAAHATKGITLGGRKEFTSAAYCINSAKCFRSRVLSHRPKRAATAERNAAPTAERA